MPVNCARRWLAYALATAFHETAFTMQPIREYGRGRGRDYGRPDPDTGQAYYGRGFVQLTWKVNYETASRALGIDCVRDPDLVMQPENAAFILFQGMKDGWFTGRRFSHYLNAEQCDYRNARRIINGTDRANTIAGYALDFEAALNAATAGSSPVPREPVPRHWLGRTLEAIWRSLRP
jgi:predicted chitinase